MHVSNVSNHIFVVAILATGVGCTIVLPRPAVPAKEVPKLDLPPPPAVPNEGQVSLDVTEGRAGVTELISTTSGTVSSGLKLGFYGGSERKPVCTTPCVVNLPYGNHKLTFASSGDGDGIDLREATMDVVIGKQPTIARAAMGRFEFHTGRKLGQYTLILLGSTVALSGAILLPIGATIDSQSGLVAGGGVSLGLGGAMLAAGIIWAVLSPSAVKQGFSSIQWAPLDGVIYRR